MNPVRMVWSFVLSILLPYAESGAANVLDLWDLNAIRSDPLDVRVLEETPGLDIHFPHRAIHLTYLSQRWKDQDVRIEAFVVIPTKQENPVPAVLSLHGHGGAGSMDDAKNQARQFKAVGMSISGPGQGKSTGRRDCTAHWIDAVENPRNSFMYQYPYAAMRAITYLTSLKEVDPKRIGVIGASMGAICTIIVNGIDSRVTAAVPVSGCGSYEPEMRAGKTWFSRLLLDALRIDADHPGVQAFLHHFDPILYAPTQHGPCLMVCGAQDEPFPITCLTRTIEKMPRSCRLTVVYDANHGGFTRPDIDFKMYDNREQWGRRVFGTAQGWLKRHLSSPAGANGAPPMPEMPKLTFSVGKENTVLFRAEPDASAPIVRVLLCWSLDGSYTFHKAVMNTVEHNCYELGLVLHQAEREGLCAFAEVEYPDNFFLTSIPLFGSKFDVQVRRTRFGIDTWRREMLPDQAIAEYKKDLEDASLKPLDRLARQYNLTRFCVDAHRPAEALELLRRIIGQKDELPKEPMVPNALYQQALILHDQGQDDEAIASLEQALRLYPSCTGLDGKEIPRARAMMVRIKKAKTKD